MLVFTLVGGVLGDRMSKARIMYICDYLKGGMILLATVLMLLFPAPSTQLAILFVLGILGSMVSGVFSPAAGALFPHIVREDQLQQANAYFTIKNALQSIFGIILAGILYTAIPVHTLFFLVGACYVASGISEMMIRYEFHPSAERLTLKLALRDMAEGIVYLRTQKAILAMLIAILFINFFLTPVESNFLPFFIKTNLTEAPSYLLSRVLMPEQWLSVIQVCFGISSLLGAALLSGKAQEDKCGKKIARLLCAMAAVFIVMTVSYLIFVERGTMISVFLIVLSLVFLAVGFLISSINIPANTLFMRLVERDKLSKVNSLISIGSMGMIPIASVLAGAIIQGIGPMALLVFCSVGFIGASLFMLLNKRVREI